jgi:hypothetical protein
MLKSSHLHCCRIVISSHSVRQFPFLVVEFSSTPRGILPAKGTCENENNTNLVHRKSDNLYLRFDSKFASSANVFAGLECEFRGGRRGLPGLRRNL